MKEQEREQESVAPTVAVAKLMTPELLAERARRLEEAQEAHEAAQGRVEDARARLVASKVRTALRRFVTAEIAGVSIKRAS